MCAGVFVLLGSALAAVNDRPILGILTQPESGNGTGTYIAASYVKFLESAGARVVPVHFDASRAELKQLFGSINGLLLPGGGADLSNGTLIHSAGRLLYDLAVAANDAGDTFPIWGTCMGFQFLSLLAARNGSVLCQHCYDTEGVALPLHFDEPAATKSRLYGHLPASLKQSLASEALTLNAHHDGIAPSTFASNARLAAAFDVLSTNVDGHGRAFVSSIEAKRYPFAGTQWHPEKNNFEWHEGVGIPHSAAAVAVSQYVANFVVGMARQSSHRFPTAAAESAALIYNDAPVYHPGGYFEQTYVFDRTHRRRV